MSPSYSNRVFESTTFERKKNLLPRKFVLHYYILVLSRIVDFLFKKNVFDHIVLETSTTQQLAITKTQLRLSVNLFFGELRRIKRSWKPRYLDITRLILDWFPIFWLVKTLKLFASCLRISSNSGKFEDFKEWQFDKLRSKKSQQTYGNLCRK